MALAIMHMSVVDVKLGGFHVIRQAAIGYITHNCFNTQNITLARHALQEARDKQLELIKLRERLLGKMVDSIN